MLEGNSKMSVLQKKHFVCTSIEKNSNKYWIIELHSNNDVVVQYGRVGGRGASETKPFTCSASAEKFFNSKVLDKQRVKPRRDAYTEIHVVNDSYTTTSPQNTPLAELALKEIQSGSPEVKDLIKYLVQTNVHNIVSNTTIKYNIAENSFRTPLGVVDKNCIDQAKTLLSQIEPFVLAEEYQSGELVKLVNQYLRYLPQDLGGSHVKINLRNIFAEGGLVKQAEIIEGLEAAIVTVTPDANAERVFETKINLLAEPPKKVSSLYNTTEYRMKSVYQVVIEPVLREYSRVGAKLDNKHLLWHGTGPGNILSILKKGLVLSYAKSGNHGIGTYFSDKASKSLSYTSSNLRGNERTRWMWIAEVALGRVVFDNRSGAPSGADSRWAHKDKYDSQIIVYKEGMANLLYLVEFTG